MPLVGTAVLTLGFTPAMRELGMLSDLSWAFSGSMADSSRQEKGVLGSAPTILTRDSATTQVDGVVYYRIYSAVSAVANVNDVHQATFLLAQTTLRNVLGTQTLSQILAGREEIAHNIQTILDDATELWGIRVARVEIKDVRIPVQLQRSMAAEAEATREARARVRATPSTLEGKLAHLGADEDRA
ncbi:stomatin-like protein 3 [Diceros bicornis minor]|uniref:stomatin-like protein 3 n=1 Tax=Diceros bicornis minor TaxID=77932 RepID=UPI0026EEFAA2|nr:stomatin-like protein 3 [Diceros bicornis minor]